MRRGDRKSKAIEKERGPDHGASRIKVAGTPLGKKLCSKGEGEGKECPSLYSTCTV